VAPLYGFFYQATLHIYPGLFITISSAGFLLVLILTFFTHRGLASSRKQAAEAKEAGDQKMEEEALMSIKNIGHLKSSML
jgi:hypothetical protein